MRLGMRILEIIKKIVIVVFIMVMTLVGWTFFKGVYFEVFYYADSRRNYFAAIGNVERIHSAELEAKSKHGKYLGLKELVKKELVRPELIDGEHLGYKFKVDLTEDDFVITATPKNKDESLVSITMKSNGKMFITRFWN